MPNNDYIWYSGPTDETGQRLAEKLKLKHGKNKPTLKNTDICICWGCKTKESVNMGKVITLNHPDKIRLNRNKFETLKRLKDHKVNVAPFVSARDVSKALKDKKSDLTLPLVGRRNYHQGGKGFWLCVTERQIKVAIDQGAQYFQNYMDIVDEYRLHIFDGKLINAQKKVVRDNMANAFKEQHSVRIQNIAKKNNVELDQNTMDYILGDLGKRQEHPDMIIKSNTRGYKFSQLDIGKLTKSKPALVDIAIKAIEVVGLNFGAVDCCDLADKSVAIIEINTGPGLQGTPFKAYAQSFKDILKTLKNPKKAEKKAGKKIAEVNTVKAKDKKKDELKFSEKLRSMAELYDYAENDEERATVKTIFDRMFS